MSNDGRIDDNRITLTLGHFPEEHNESLNVSPETKAILRLRIEESSEEEVEFNFRNLPMKIEHIVDEVEDDVQINPNGRGGRRVIHGCKTNEEEGGQIEGDVDVQG